MSLQNAVVHNILNFSVLEQIVTASVVTHFSGTFAGVWKTVKNCGFFFLNNMAMKMFLQSDLKKL